MGSEFLKKLKESVETGKPNDAVKAVYNEILDKADKIADNPESLKEIEEKGINLSENFAEEKAKKLTIEEVTRLNEIAKQEEERMLKFEEQLTIQSGKLIITTEIEKYERLITDFKTRLDLLDSDASYAEKKKLIDRTISDIND